jgi:hypothetical protein
MTATATVKRLLPLALATIVGVASGHILRGGTGFAVATLPPAARMAMTITNGVRPMPFAKAASALV